MNSIRTFYAGASGIFVAAAVLLHASAAGATTFFLSTTEYSGGPGECGIGDAVAAINFQTPVAGCPAGDGMWDVIFLSPGQTYDVSNGLDILAPMIIVGDGPGASLWSNGLNSPAINVYDCNVVFQDLTFFGSNAFQPTQGIRISSQGFCPNLSLSYVRLTGFANGAISNDGGMLLIDHSTLDTNTTTSSQNGGALTVRGGGLVEIHNSTIANNRALNGGGIRVRGGYAQVFYSTIAGNRATSGNGGGGYSRLESGESFAELDLVHVTVARNTASGQGGGIYNHTSASVSSKINGSIVALNTSGSNNTPDDLRGRLRSDNLAFHDGKNKNLFTWLPNNPRPPGYDSSLDIINTNPRIGSLSSGNGGPTATIALQTGSPAINAGVDSVPSDPEHNFDMQFSSDQRGFAAPKPSNGAHDLGSYER